MMQCNDLRGSYGQSNFHLRETNIWSHIRMINAMGPLSGVEKSSQRESQGRVCNGAKLSENTSSFLFITLSPLLCPTCTHIYRQTWMAPSHLQTVWSWDCSGCTSWRSKPAHALAPASPPSGQTHSRRSWKERGRESRIGWEKEFTFTDQNKLKGPRRERPKC